MKFKFSKAKIIGFIILNSCFAILVACSLGRPGGLVTLATNIPSRTIIDGNLPFHVVWRRTGLLLLNTKADLLHVQGDQLFFVCYENDGAKRRLQVLNANTGELLWKTDPLTFSVNSLTADGQRVYLALSAKIIVYDLATGRVLWEDALLGGRTTYWVYPINHSVLVYSEEDTSSEGVEELVIREYDAETGSLIRIDRTDIGIKNSNLILKTPNYDYWTDRNTLWAINTESKQEQWKVKIDDVVEYQPLLIGSGLVFASGIFSDMICVDNMSGRETWKYKNKIVANLMSKQGIIYVIRTDAAIVGLDSRTGEEIGYINIEPSLTETSSRSHAYLIADSENELYVYYGDSQELIAFSR